jgi:hypothetical protein
MTAYEHKLMTPYEHELMTPYEHELIGISSLRLPPDTRRHYHLHPKQGVLLLLAPPELSE